MTRLRFTPRGSAKSVEASKKRLIEEGTAILGKHAALGEGKVPAYVAVQEIPEINWGMYGKQVDLSAMRAPATA